MRGETSHAKIGEKRSFQVEGTTSAKAQHRKSWLLERREAQSGCSIVNEGDSKIDEVRELIKARSCNFL